MKKSLLGSALAILLLVLSLTACGQKPAQQTDTTKTAPVQSSNNTATEKPSTPAQVLLTESDAKALVKEKLPTGDTAGTGSAVTIGSGESAHQYYIFQISDAKNAAIGKIAVDRESGELYNYTSKGTIEDYSKFPLYQSAADAVYSWDGTFARDENLLVELSQQDDQSFEFAFSDGTEGIARISGSKATSTDDKLVFTFVKKNVLHVEDQSGTYRGNYQAKTASE